MHRGNESLSGKSYYLRWRKQALKPLGIVALQCDLLYENAAWVRRACIKVPIIRGMVSFYWRHEYEPKILRMLVLQPILSFVMFFPHFQFNPLVIRDISFFFFIRHTFVILKFVLVCSTYYCYPCNSFDLYIYLRISVLLPFFPVQYQPNLFI